MRVPLDYTTQRHPKFNNEHMTFDDLIEMANHEGIEYREVETPQNFRSTISTGIIHDEKGEIYFKKPIIIANRTCHKRIKWFLLGHELGHYFLRHPTINLLHQKMRKIEISNEIVSLCEEEADFFAQLTFIPTKYLEDKYGDDIRKFIDTQENDGNLFDRILDDLLKFSVEKLEFEHPSKNLLETLKLRIHRYYHYVKTLYIDAKGNPVEEKVPYPEITYEKNETFFVPNDDVLYSKSA